MQQKKARNLSPSLPTNKTTTRNLSPFLSQTTTKNNKTTMQQKQNKKSKPFSAHRQRKNTQKTLKAKNKINQ